MNSTSKETSLTKRGGQNCCTVSHLSKKTCIRLFSSKKLIAFLTALMSLKTILYHSLLELHPSYFLGPQNLRISSQQFTGRLLSTNNCLTSFLQKNQSRTGCFAVSVFVLPFYLFTMLFKMSCEQKGTFEFNSKHHSIQKEVSGHFSVVAHSSSNQIAISNMYCWHN